MLAPLSPPHPHGHVGFRTTSRSSSSSNSININSSRDFGCRVKSWAEQEQRTRDQGAHLHTPWQAAQQQTIAAASHQSMHNSYRATTSPKRSFHQVDETIAPPALARLPTIEALRSRPSSRPLLTCERLSPSLPCDMVRQEWTLVSSQRPSSAACSPPLAATTRDSASDGDGSCSPSLPHPELCKSKKRQRYLRDVDRRSILRRIENGEKQAALAREFGVTRAAICHIKKNRDEIISRYDSLLKSAQEMERTGGTVAKSPRCHEPPMVEELTRQSVSMLLTTLRDATTPPRTFRLAANRLMMILLEEALAAAAAVDCDVVLANGETVRGVKPDPNVCCVSVGQKGLPLLRLYHQIEPTRAVGCIHLRSGRHRGSCTEVDRMELPRELGHNSSVLLFSSTSTTGDSLCTALEALVELGVLEDRVRVVLLACTGAAMELVGSQFPGVRVLTSVMESAAFDICETTLGDFLKRYNDVDLEPTPSQTT